MAERTESVLASRQKTAEHIIKNLARHGMDGYYCATSAEAVELVRSWMAAGESVTWGGSETFKESGMKPALEDAGCYRMLDRASATTPEEQREMWRDRSSADWFFMRRERPHLGRRAREHRRQQRPPRPVAPRPPRTWWCSRA